jgi:hypothetical protein
MANQTKQAPKLNDKVQAELNALSTTSAKIRFLDKKGLSRGDISRALGIRYQHVRNVLTQPLKAQS